MKFNIHRINSGCIFAYTHENYKKYMNHEVHYVFEDGKEYFAYLSPRSLGKYEVLQDLSLMQEDELFQYSLIHDPYMFDIDIMCSLQKRMKEVWDSIKRGDCIEYDSIQEDA